MIISIPILDRHLYPDLCDQMLELRTRVFKENLNWDVFVDDLGREIDQFDNIPGVYLVSVDDEMAIQASMRLLPTTGRYMAESVFQDLMEGNEPPRSAQVWEVSRFFSRPPSEVEKGQAKRIWANGSRSEHVVKLLCAVSIFATNNGLTKIVGVVDLAVERFYKSLGLDCHRMGPPRKIGNSRAFVGEFDTNLELASKVAEAWNFSLDELMVDVNSEQAKILMAQNSSKKEIHQYLPIPEHKSTLEIRV